jgi:hypothetical protein
LFDQGLGSLANTIGIETLVKILPSIAAMGGSTRTRPLLITEVFSPVVSDPMNNNDEGDNSIITSRMSSDGAISDEVNGMPKIETIGPPSGSMQRSISVTSTDYSNHLVQPPSTPLTTEEVQEARTWSIPLIGGVRDVRSAARRKIVGAVRQWTPGGRCNSYPPPPLHSHKHFWAILSLINIYIGIWNDYR